MLTREQLLGEFTPRLRNVETAIGDVWIRTITEDEKCRCDGNLWKDDGTIDTAKLAARKRRYVITCVCGAVGEALFQPGDEKQLGRMDAAVLSQIWEAIIDHVNLNGEREKTLVKNSEEAGGGDSPTGFACAGE